jgi:hypothetical protein
MALLDFVQDTIGIGHEVNTWELLSMENWFGPENLDINY